MILDFIYLFIQNNIIAFSNTIYLRSFFNTIFLLTISSTIPYYTLDLISNLSPIDTINIISSKLSHTLYQIPSFIILFIIHNSKLCKLLGTTFKVRNNPNHIYLTCFSTFMYIIFYVINIINDSYLISYYISNILSYSIFFNEIAYTFLDNNKYNYNNRIDFYNNNYKIFIFYGAITSYLLFDISNKIFLPISFIICSTIQNGIVDIKYNKQVDTNKYNILYPIEVLFNPIITFIGNFLLFWLKRRNMINIKY
mgnify:CR=1 FL=1